MPPRKRTEQATRRSARIAASSRASSVSAEETTSGLSCPLLPPRTPSRTAEKGIDTSHLKVSGKIRKNKNRASSFKLAGIIESILNGRRDIIPTLTEAQKAAVVNGIADRNHDLQRRIEELESRNQYLAQERDQAVRRSQEKPSLRDHFFRERINATRAQIDAQSDDSPASSSALVPAQQAAQSPEDRPILAGNGTSPAKPNTTRPQNELAPVPETPAKTSNTQNTSETQFTTPASEKPTATGLFRRVFSSFGSPFSALRRTPQPVQLTAPQHTPTTQPARQASLLAEPLGELPMSRKRPALEPIAEHSELSRDVPPENAPSSATHATHASQTPSRPPRSVAKIRRAAKDSASKTPSRSWTSQPTPRQPNADARLEKLRQYRQLQEDSEIQEMLVRPVKRVKIDDLVSIPHNKPGEPEGTFRLYDIDSDEEMEVDEDVPLRQNMFAMTEAKQNTSSAKPTTPTFKPSEPATTSASTASTLTSSAPVTSLPATAATTRPTAPANTAAKPFAPAIAASTPPAPSVLPQVDVMKLQFPSVGKVESGAQPNEYLGKKFAYGLAHYRATGELIAW